MKAFSKKYLDKLSFGEVRQTDALCSDFKVEKFPTLMVVVGDESEIYEGEMKVDQIQKFLSNYAYQSTTKKVRKLEFEKLTEKNQNKLCGTKLCLLLFVLEESQVQEF